jgi:DnaJ family protein C protein 8
MAASTSEKSEPQAEALFSDFYTEVKEIEKRDSVLTPKQQIDRLTRPGATYFNLNPFDVLQVDPETPLNEMKQKYRRMSILVHPDKNQDDVERSQKAFDALAKAYKTLENEEGYKRCQEIVEEAKTRVEESMKVKRKQAKKEGQTKIPEDDMDEFKRAVYVHTCKLFADLERLRQERETKDAHEKKRKAVEEEEEEVQKKTKAEWDKNYEASRSNRVESWRDWKTGSKKAKGVFRPPKPKAEKR